MIERYGIRAASPLSNVWQEMLPAGVLPLGFVLRIRGTAAVRGAVGRVRWGGALVVTAGTALVAVG